MGRLKQNLLLFGTMLKIGLFTFGGGYAMIALLENEFVTKKKWLDKEEFLDLAAIAESTPGPIAINAATYIGFQNGGVLGSLTATLGICLPSFVIIYLISLCFDAFLSLRLVEHAFRGIQVCVVYLILSAGLRMLKGMKKTPLNLCVLTGTVVGMVVFSLLAIKFTTVFYILISGTLGVLVYFVTESKRRAEK